MPINNRTMMWNRVKRQKQLILISIPFIIYIFIFFYLPLGGLVMAFQNFRPNPHLSWYEHEWVGFFQFQRLFTDDSFIRVIRNTFAMGFINLILSFVTAIVFALLLNEIFNRKFKRVIQTISYLPHFLSWIIVTSLVSNMLSMEGGMINAFLGLFGIGPIHFLGRPDLFWWIVGWSHVWKNLGWNTIIYMATIAGIDPQLYESAQIDGANRFQRAWHITLASMKPTITILLILNLGWVLNAGFEIQFLLGSGLVADVAQTIDIFVIRRGIALNNFSLATAAGLFRSLVAVVMILICNFIAGRLEGEQVI